MSARPLEGQQLSTRFRGFSFIVFNSYLLTMDLSDAETIDITVDPDPWPSQIFVAKLDVQVLPEFVTVNKEMSGFTLASRIQFKDFVESTIEEVIETGCVFFEMIKLIKDAIKDDIKGLATWGHRVRKDDFPIYGLCVKQFTRILNSIDSKSKTVLIEDQEFFSETIRDMIEVFEKSKAECPKLRTGIAVKEPIKKKKSTSKKCKPKFQKIQNEQSRPKSLCKDWNSTEPMFTGVLPSEQFVAHLREFYIAEKHFKLDNVLSDFTDASAQQFTNYIETHLEAVLNEADGFVQFLQKGKVRKLTGRKLQNLTRLRICVQRVARRNYDRYSQFSTLFVKLMSNVLCYLGSRASMFEVQSMQRMIKAIEHSEVYCPRLVRRCESN